MKALIAKEVQSAKVDHDNLLLLSKLYSTATRPSSVRWAIALWKRGRLLSSLPSYPLPRAPTLRARMRSPLAWGLAPAPA
jgi:hypothetical protein